MTALISVLKPGLSTTLQDLGRYGHQRFGVLVNGAMDTWSHRIANRLVGNDESAATLEITLVGPNLEFDADALIALTGGELDARIDGRAIGGWRPLLVRAGARLELGRVTLGARAYLAVAGGFAVTPLMGSRSTYLRGGFGGFQGRALVAGDRLAAGPDADLRRYADLWTRFEAGDGAFVQPPWSVARKLAWPFDATVPIRAVPGPQWQRLDAESRRRFAYDEFRVGTDSDRMGYRLDGPRLRLSTPLEMLSDATDVGLVQLPPDGRAIVLMADRQTTGGYPRIAVVSTVDLPRLAQLLPGQRLRFAPITLAESQALLLAREAELRAIARAIEAKR